MSIILILYLLAFISFCLAAGGAPGIGWRDMGFAFLTLSLFVK